MALSLSAIKQKIFSKQAIFFGGAICLFVLVTWTIISSFTFLLKNLNRALTSEVNPTPVIPFDIKGFEELNLIPKEPK